MPAGIIIKHKRKTTNFVGGELAAGEMGLNTVSGIWFFSVDGSTVTSLASGSTAGGKSILLLAPNAAASAVGTNLALNAFNAVSDPSFRQFHDLRGMTKARIQGRIGGTLTAVTKLRFQYHLGVNPAVVTGDAGWTTLAESAGVHTVNVMFYSAEISIPAGAQINNVLLRVGLFSGDGIADPTVTCAILNVYV